MRNTRIKRNEKSRKVKRFIFRTILAGFLLVVLGIPITLLVIYHGPFTDLKENLVATAMTTYRHRYIATWFLSEKEINEIMEKNKVHDEGKQSDIAAIATAPIVNTSNTKAVVEEKKEADDVVFEDISTDKIKAYVLKIKDPKRVAVASIDKIGSAGMKLADIVKKYGAIGGINAGGFADEGGHGNGGTPLGVLIEDGKVVYGNETDAYSIIGLNENSVLVLGRYTLKEMREKKIRNAVSFGPFLIVNGETTIKSGNGGWGLAPRTAIGQAKDGTIIFLVIDGRQATSLGATLKDVQDMMVSQGAYNAANLDGGSSTTMVYNGKIVNSPSSIYGPRSLPSAFIIKAPGAK
jgi:exopolysaccharide biosynthesis protein